MSDFDLGVSEHIIPSILSNTKVTILKHYASYKQEKMTFLENYMHVHCHTALLCSKH